MIKYINSLKIVDQPTEAIPVLSLSEQEIVQTIKEMRKRRELISSGLDGPISQAINQIRSGGEVDRELALLLAQESIWDLIGLAWVINQELGPHESHHHICTGSYGLNTKCPQACMMCSFSERSIEPSLISQPETQRTPKEFAAEARRQVELARAHNPEARIAFKVTHIGRGIAGNKRLTEVYVAALKAVNQVEGIDQVDACLGLLDEESAQAIAPWVDTYNCNLERIQRPGEQWVTNRHSLDDKVETLRLAKRAGMRTCSGILVGAGESVEDVVDILLKLRELVKEEIINSSPLNCFVPIFPSDIQIVQRVPAEHPILALCLARIILPGHPFFPNAGRYRFGQYLPAMHAIASGYSSHHNYLTKFVDEATDARIISCLKKEQ